MNTSDSYAKPLILPEDIKDVVDNSIAFELNKLLVTKKEVTFKEVESIIREV